jgi:uncharacterized protein YcbK (DUF882 family)
MITFEQLVETWSLRHFQPSELLTMGASNEWFHTNHNPPPELWENIKDAAIVADEARERMGCSIKIISGYRSPAYNKSIGGAKNSLHSQFRALDLVPTNGKVSELYRILRDLRMEGYAGARGLGKYRTFCHTDNGPRREW